MKNDGGLTKSGSSGRHEEKWTDEKIFFQNYDSMISQRNCISIIKEKYGRHARSMRISFFVAVNSQWLVHFHCFDIGKAFFAMKALLKSVSYWCYGMG